MNGLPLPALWAISNWALESSDATPMIRVATINQCRKSSRVVHRIHDRLKCLIYFPARRFIEPLPEHGVLALKVDTLLPSLGYDPRDQSPDRNDCITIPIVPRNTKIACESTGTWYLNRTLVVQWVEVQGNLVLTFKRPVGFDNLQQFHRLPEVDKLALIDTQDLQVSHLWD